MSRQSEQLMERGIALVEAKAFKEAIKCFSKVLVLDDQHFEAYYRRGHCWASVQQFKRAEKDFFRAMKLNPQHPESAFYLGLLWERQGEGEKAKQYFEKAAALDYEPAAKRLRIKETAVTEAPSSETAESLVSQGLKLWAAGQLDEALAALARALALNPDYWQAYFNRGAFYYSVKQYEHALAEYDKAVELAPQEGANYFSRGRVYHLLEKYEQALQDYTRAMDQGDLTQEMRVRACVARARVWLHFNQLDKSLQDLQEANKLQPLDADIYYERGLVYMWQGEFRKALVEFQQAAQYEPDNSEYVYRVGTGFYALDDAATAVQHFTQAIQMNPTMAEAYVDRGVAYGRLGQMDKKIGDLQKAIDLKPDYAMAYYNLGNTYYQMKEYPKAIEFLSKTIELKPDYLEAYTTRGTVYLLTDRPGAAIQEYREALKLNPQDAVTRYNLFNLLQDWQPDNAQEFAIRGALLAEMNAPKQALADYKEALRRDRELVDVYHERGMLYMQLGENQGAIQDFTVVLRHEPDNVMVLVNRANCLLVNGRYTEALRDAQRASQIDPEHPKTHHAIANAYARLKRHPEAVQAYNRAIEVGGDDPDTALSYNSRGIIWVLEGDDERALADFKKAAELMPAHAKAHYNMGGVYHRRHQLGWALEAFERAADLGYEDAAVAYQQLDAQINMAVETKQASLQKQQNLNDPTKYVDLAYSYYQSEQYEEALTEIEQALRLDNKHARAYMVRALIYRAREQYTKAMHELNQAIKADEMYVEAYLNRANLYIVQKQHDKAMADLGVAIKLFPHDARPVYSLGNMLMHMGDMERAQRYLEKATQLDAKLGDAYFDLGHIYDKKGDWEKAQAYYERSGELGDLEAAKIAANLRQRLAAPLGDLADEKLSKSSTEEDELTEMAAQVLSQFAYDLSGERVETYVRPVKKGLFGRKQSERVQIVKWRVVKERMSTVSKAGYLGELPGATLELPQVPPSIVRLSAMNEDTFDLQVMAEIRIEEATVEGKQAFASVRNDSVLAEPISLRIALDELVKEGYLVVKNGRLQYSGKK